MESWRDCWRRGVAPQLSTAGLEALRQALLTDDARLLQGNTTMPPAIDCCLDWPVEAACLLGYCMWQDGSCKTVGEVEIVFGELCYRCDEILGEPASCRWVLNAWDDEPRDEIRLKMMAEVELELARRSAGDGPDGPTPAAAD